MLPGLHPFSQSIDSRSIDRTIDDAITTRTYGTCSGW
jgi:hypothetical protein